MMWRGLILSGAVLFYSGLGWSDVIPKAEDFTIHQEYTSTRALGMGNAFTAIADDHSAIFYNPAALAFRKDGHLRMFLRAGIDAHIKKAIEDMKDLNSLPEGDQQDAAADFLSSRYGQHFYARVPTLGAVWVRPRWGIAFIPSDLSLDMSVHRNVGPTLAVNAYHDSTLAYSYARTVRWLPKTHELAYGITLKGVYRVYLGKMILAPQLVENNDIFDKKTAQEGLTGDIDVGFMWKPPVPTTGFFKILKFASPTFAFVGRNLVDYGFTKSYNFVSDGDTKPPHLVRRFDVGSKWELPKFWVFDPHLSADIRDIGHENWTPAKGTHFGAEFYWKMYNWWKGHWAAGFNQGYWTAGLGARMAWFQFDAATFGEEVGSPSAPQESRRYMIELALDF